MANPVTVAARSLSKRSPVFRRYLRASVRAARRVAYRRAATGPVEPRHVLFESFQGRSVSGSPRAIHEHLLADPRFADWTFTWAVPGTPQGPSVAFEDPRTSCVVYRSAAYHAAAATAGWWVTNAIMPEYLAPRPGQRQLQTWHGTPLKRLGADIIDGTATATSGKDEIVARYARAGRAASYLLSPSEFASRTFAAAFVLPAERAREVVREIGNPRNDALAAPAPGERERVLATLGVDPARRVVLYAPTWRDDRHSSRTGYTLDLGLDLAALADALGDDTVVLVRAHYLVAEALDAADLPATVVDVSRHGEINDLYLASDLLVTDYSSALFDYVLLDRPMVFFMHDLEHYRDRLRGLYLDPEELPGPVVTDQDSLAAAIATAPDRQNAESAARAAFRAVYATYDDGGACARAADLLLRGVPEVAS